MHSFEEHIKKAAERYVDGIEHGGLQPSEKLVRALVQRAQEDYKKQIVEEHLDNLDNITRAHNKRENEIKRECAKLRMWTCPPIALFFALMAWYSFSHTGDSAIIIGVIHSVGSLAFLGMLVFGAIFDKPVK